MVLEEPRGIVSSSDVLLVSSAWLIGMVEMGEAIGRLLLNLRVRASAPAGAENIVDVDGLGEGLELGLKGHALIRDTDHVGHVPVTVGSDELIVELLANKGVPVAHVDISSVGVVLPVGDAITDGETLKVRLEDGIIISVLLVVLVNIVGKVGDVDTSIGLTRDVKLIIGELGELLEPLEGDGQVVLAAFLVIRVGLREH